MKRFFIISLFLASNFSKFYCHDHEEQQEYLEYGESDNDYIDQILDPKYNYHPLALHNGI
jgi:hypothetical protein